MAVGFRQNLYGLKSRAQLFELKQQVRRLGYLRADFVLDQGLIAQVRGFYIVKSGRQLKLKLPRAVANGGIIGIQYPYCGIGQRRMPHIVQHIALQALGGEGSHAACQACQQNKPSVCSHNDG